MVLQYPLQQKHFSIFFNLANSITLDINLPPSPICLFLTYAVCCEDIKSGKTAFDMFFRSTFNKEMCLQLFMHLFSLLFFL